LDHVVQKDSEPLVSEHSVTDTVLEP